MQAYSLKTRITVIRIAHAQIYFSVAHFRGICLISTTLEASGRILWRERSRQFNYVVRANSFARIAVVDAPTARMLRGFVGPA